MTRPKQPHTAAEVDAEIRRLTEQRERLVAQEDQRRGVLLRAYLKGAEGDALRALLARAAEPRDAYLFGLADSATGSPLARDRRSRRTGSAPAGASAAATV